MRIVFTVYGVPVGKARPRVVRLKTGESVTFTPKNTKNWEELIRYQALDYRPEKLLDGPLFARIAFYLPRPRSAPKKRKYPDVKPDHDNLEKAVFDALEGIIYTNDSRIVEKHFKKLYGDPPRVEIEIGEVS